jgi:hypothetical protein
MLSEKEKGKKRERAESELDTLRRTALIVERVSSVEYNHVVFPARISRRYHSRSEVLSVLHRRLQEEGS